MREKWIRAKYQHKHFVCKESSIFTEKRNRFRRFKENKKQRSSRRKAKEKENATVKTGERTVIVLGGWGKSVSRRETKEGRMENTGSGIVLGGWGKFVIRREARKGEDGDHWIRHCGGRMGKSVIRREMREGRMEYTGSGVVLG